MRKDFVFVELGDFSYKGLTFLHFFIFFYQEKKKCPFKRLGRSFLVTTLKGVKLRQKNIQNTKCMKKNDIREKKKRKSQKNFRLRRAYFFFTYFYPSPSPFQIRRLKGHFVPT